MTTTLDPIVASSLKMDAEHRYWLGAVEVPSVTTVINSVLPGWKADEWYMQRGTALHHGCRLLDEGRLDRSSVAPEIAGRIRAWEKFRADFPGTMIACELALAHPTFRFAGTLDRVFCLHGALVVCDIKSSIAPQAKIQLGAYKLLWDGNNDNRTIVEGVVVELGDEGAYKCVWINRKQIELCSRVFLAALTLYGFKRKENIP